MSRAVYTATPVGLTSAFRDALSQSSRLGFTSVGAYTFACNVVFEALRVVNTPLRARLRSRVIDPSLLYHKG